MAETSGQPPAARGAAWRRRQRRLRSMLRHERQTVRMELAAALYHSWGGGLETYEGLRAQKTASAGPAEYFELSSDDGRPAGGERPAALLEPAALQEPRPQERDRRHAGVGYEIAQNLEVPSAADGRTAARRPPVLRHLLAGGCRAGHRSAEDLPGHDSAALGGSSAPAADGGTVGACADCLVLFFAPAAYCRADRRHSSSGWRRRRGGVEVFKVLSQDRIQQHCTLSRPLTFQFQVVLGKGGVEVFKVLLDRVQQPLHLTLVLLMALCKGFFALFPERKKVRSKVRTRGRNWVRTLIHPR